jgi:hypothetical protein
MLAGDANQLKTYCEKPNILLDLTMFEDFISSDPQTIYFSPYGNASQNNSNVSVV